VVVATEVVRVAAVRVAATAVRTQIAYASVCRRLCPRMGSYNGH